MASINIIIIIFLFLISSSSAAVDDHVEVASTDYGNTIHNRPSSVLQPSSVEDIIKLIRNTTTTKKLAARGHGHSLRGQAMALNGVVVNMTALKNPNVVEIGKDDSSSAYYADVVSGELWIDVLRATLKQNLAPVSWTDYLYLTVGGTLSNAGISGQAFKRGPQIKNVLQLDVVTGSGVNITCSPNNNSELFNGVLGGLGQFGIITKARIVLETAPIGVKWARLIYNNFSSFTQDQEYLINDNNNNGLISYVEGLLILNATTVTSQWSPLFTISNPQQSQIAALLNNQSRILYSIELALYYNNQTAQAVETEFEKLHKDLKFVQGLNFSKDAAFSDFINRVPNLDTPAMGSTMAHPWLNLFIPSSRIFDFNRLVLAGMLPDKLSQQTGLIIFYPLNKKRWDDNMSAVTPDKEDVFYTLGLLHTAETDNYQTFDDFNNEIMSVCQNASIEVKQYLAGYKTQGEWMKHFGQTKWSVFSKRKNTFDPNNILSPGQAIF